MASGESFHPLKAQSEVVWLLPESQTERVRTGQDANQLLLVGGLYNFCWEHESLRLEVGPEEGRRWRGRTPAMAAGLTDHRWSVQELLSYQVPPAPWVAPKRRGRPPRQHQEMPVAI